MPGEAKESMEGPCKDSDKELSFFLTQSQAKGGRFKLLPAGLRFSMKKISLSEMSLWNALLREMMESISEISEDTVEC